MPDPKIEAFASLLEQVASAIKLTLWQQFPGLFPQDRDDIDQEVRIKFWKSLAGGKKLDNPTLYIRRMTYSTAIDCVRRLKRRPVSVGMIFDKEAAAEIPASRQDSPEYNLDSQVLRRVMEDALGALLGTRRTVVKLHLAGMEMDEIAVHLGWSSNRVRHLLYRGLDDLRRELRLRGAVDARPDKAVRG